MAGRVASLGAWAGARVLVLSPTPTHPQDYGNRKRIYEVCRRFADGGAKVTFVHYAAEQEWRGALPWSAEREMIGAWAQYYTVGPTRELHANPKGRHHSIDEWWDEAIGGFLHWLFSVRTFDIFIVNYSWLSKAFEYAPRSVFKILDTHDKVSGRREILESMGLDPEFFFTTDAEERIALRRADLVWAIKKEERALFEGMSETPVLTLPHVDPFRALERPSPDVEGYLRVGIIGARNNINRVNITQFLKAAEPIFREAFAPVKIVIAGSICEMLTDIDNPFVELRGRVGNVEDFYRTVDCVAVPMKSSTGLKIKTGEAISLRMPVISLAHAFEGYEPTDKLHTLADFSDMARALVDLAFGARGKLDFLAGASQRSHAKTTALIAETMEKSGALARAKSRLIVIAVDSRAFVPGSVFNMVLTTAHQYLHYLANTVILVVRGSAADVAGNVAAVDGFRRVVASADLEDAERLGEPLAALGVDVFDVEAFLRRMRPQVIMADALHPALSKDCCPDAVIFSRTEMIAFSEGGADFQVPGRGYRRAFVSTPAPSREVAAQMASTGADLLLQPCFWRSEGLKFVRARKRGDAKTVVLLGAPAAPAVTMAIAIARSWGLEPYIVYGFRDCEDFATRPATSVPSVRADEYLDSIMAGRTPPPDFAVDMSAGRYGLTMCREFLERLRIPVVQTVPVGLHGSLDLGMRPLQASSEGQLWNAFRSLAMDSRETHERNFEDVWQDLDSDRGWACVWRYCSRLFETDDVEFA